MKKILMHVCCAPCFVVPFYRLQDRYDLTALWFNHNIHPFIEYNSRYQSFIDFVSNETIALIDNGSYGNFEFINKAVFNKENRCFMCYFERLEMTAKKAKENNFDYFSSSLLYSKRQKHEMIKEIGETLAKQHGVEFFYQDFREYWQEGIELSKAKSMYRQKYCGCIFSEMERKKDQ